jgi:hypothetical protein
MKKYFAFLLLLPFSLFAEAPKLYEWENNRTRYKLSEKEAQYAEYMLKSHVQYDYVLEDNQFIMYTTHHRIIYVNSNEAIEKHNRISISMNSTFELVELKARSINKEGKVVNFDKNNLKEVKGDKEDSRFRIFAVEGVELGSEIEFFFVRKMESYLFERVFMQMDVPVKNSSFLLSCPPHLIFDFKSYLGFPDVKKTEVAEKNVFVASQENIPAMKKEEFSYYDCNRKRIEFKLAYNSARSKERMYTWDEAAKKFYARITTLTKDEDKAIEKFYKTINDNPSAKLEQRINNIEEKLKTSIQVDKEAAGPAVTDVASVLKYKIASNEGMTKLMTGVFNFAKIPVHIVLTCDREIVKFDGSFDTWGFLDEYLLYFPDTKGFLAPYLFEYRYPFIPTELAFNSGLFIEPFAMGALKSGLGTIQKIPAIDYTLNYDNLTMDISFSDDLSINNIKERRDFGGYNGRYLIPYYPRMSKEDKQRLVEELTKQTAPDATITNWSATVTKKDIYESFNVVADYSSTHFLEKAGPKLLFKVGELIGAQTEMYQENQRLTSIENDYNRLYDRIIKIRIPDGYTIKNPDDLKKEVRYSDNGNYPHAFLSSYSLNGNDLEIKLHEYYQEISAPLERYEDFRKVINAAADFNKVTLVLEKKK